VIPPGQAPVPALNGASKRRCHNVKPVSLSMAKTLFELPVTIESGVKSMTPLTVMPCISGGC
jgi:hypothetical protein